MIVYRVSVSSTRLIDTDFPGIYSNIKKVYSQYWDFCKMFNCNPVSYSRVAGLLKGQSWYLANIKSGVDYISFRVLKETVK